MITSFELFTEGLKSFSFLLNKDELDNYFAEKIDLNTFKELYKESKPFNDKERSYILMYTGGDQWLPNPKKRNTYFFNYSPLKNIKFRVEKYSIRHKGNTHMMYILKVNDDDNNMYYARNLISCFKKMDELQKTTKKVFRDWL